MTVTAEHASELNQGAKSLGLSLSQAQQDKLLAYLALLIKWNKAYNLTAVRDPDEMVSRHLLDSLSVVKHVQQVGDNLLDVGSGGGMPGIPLAIIYPQRKVTLLDSNGKKTRFLTQVKLELGLDNVDVIHKRVEEYVPKQPFTGIISRAFSALDNFTNWTRHLGDQHTQWLAMKGIHPDDELQVVAEDFQLTHCHVLQVPGCQGQRHLLILQHSHKE
ncbi:16S rRNA (guanine(527)-N(7))-methyltransferase RsmG [Pseudomonas sp. F1_0610]|uniref:16S rRNA (guanine(527)-N(7))-methyltransferase RsmG n=1 Tax=Pseudomonas sp. F1_0610 TaxID=3114284 RepID=UPI0039C3D36C